MGLVDNKEKYRQICETEGVRIPLFQQYWWWETVCRGKRWDVLLSERDGQVRGAMPYVDGRRLCLRHSLMPQLTMFTGPWLADNADKEAFDDLWRQFASRRWALCKGRLAKKSMELFEKLMGCLADKCFPACPEQNVSDKAYATFAFFESYFSNYIEGTEFELEEARRIVETGVVVPTRDADSHDILGTYAVVSNRSEMSRTATTSDEFLDILCGRHRLILAGRPSSSPGRFKTRDNRAGDTHFVSFDHVRGTLKRGFEMSRAIANPFARAIFMLFVTSEVHPFADGNGRVSRIMMNAELTAAGQAKIIVPTVFRPDYIGALRRMSRIGDPEALVAAMTRLRDFCRLLAGDDFEAMRRQLDAANAFKDDEASILRF